MKTTESSFIKISAGGQIMHPQSDVAVITFPSGLAISVSERLISILSKDGEMTNIKVSK